MADIKEIQLIDAITNDIITNISEIGSSDVIDYFIEDENDWYANIKLPIVILTWTIDFEPLTNEKSDFETMSILAQLYYENLNFNIVSKEGLILAKKIKKQIAYQKYGLDIFLKCTGISPAMDEKFKSLKIGRFDITFECEMID